MEGALEWQADNTKLVFTPDELLEKAPRYKIKIYRSILDTLKTEPTNMIVLKEHFPGRTIAPSLQPFMALPRWTAYLKNIE